MKTGPKKYGTRHRLARDAVFALNLRRLRRQSGMSITEMAKKSGLWPHGVYQIEAGKSDPCFSTACRLADLLGVCVSEFRRVIETVPKKIRQSV